MNLFKYFLEADDDNAADANAGNDAAAGNDTGDVGDNADANDNAADNTNDNDAGEDDNNPANDDFSMDADLGDDSGGEDAGGDSGGGDFSSGGGTGEEEQTDEEVKKQNADMFSSLSPEEQKIKILELKKLYLELYTNCDDILQRVNDMPVDEDTIDIIGRISTSMYRIKVEMEDYLRLKFPNATYYENDVAYNRFLYFYSSVADIIEETAKKRQKEIENADKK